jgi:hypothetical protein
MIAKNGKAATREFCSGKSEKLYGLPGGVSTRRQTDGSSMWLLISGCSHATIIFIHRQEGDAIAE